jgi:hypothetical protein
VQKKTSARYTVSNSHPDSGQHKQDMMPQISAQIKGEVKMAVPQFANQAPKTHLFMAGIRPLKPGGLPNYRLVNTGILAKQGRARSGNQYRYPRLGIKRSEGLETGTCKKKISNMIQPDYQNPGRVGQHLGIGPQSPSPGKKFHQYTACQIQYPSA